MSNPVRLAILVLILTVSTSSGARGQSAWDAPMLMAPGAPAGWGFHLVDPHPGNGLGVMGMWRSAPAPVGLGFRLGLYEGAGDDLALIGGVDVSGTLHRGTDDAPFDVIWFAGGGLGIDDDVLLSFPLGISAGWSFSEPGFALRPYVAPRLVLDVYIADDGPGNRRGGDDLDLDGAVEIGADLAFSPSFAIRAAVSFGGRDALSIGVAIPGR
jgi:hypothetical protein